jgi:acyl carrier protein
MASSTSLPAQAALSSIRTRVLAIIAQQLHTDECAVVPSASITHDLGADSLDAIELIMALEDEFGIEISDEYAEAISTVQQAIDHVVRALIQQGRPHG